MVKRSGSIRFIASLLVLLAAPLVLASPALGAPLPSPASLVAGQDPRLAALTESVLYCQKTVGSVGEDGVADPNVYREYAVRLDQAQRKLRAVTENDAAAPSVLDVKATATRLHGAADEVSTSHEAKVTADEAARKAAEEAAAAEQAAAARENSYASEEAARTAAAQTGATPYQGGDGVWHLQYHNDYGSASGDASGALTQWADGYYIAHNWSDNGARISSQPEYVEVDGRTYRLAGSQEVSRDTTWEDIEGWVHQNGGIGMQTCVEGGGYLVNHYEPVG